MKRFFNMTLLWLTIVPAMLIAREPVQGLGFAAGQPAGLGISYRYLGDHYGVQVTLGAVSNKADDFSDHYAADYAISSGEDGKPGSVLYTARHYLRETDGNLGVLLFKVLHSAKRSRFYVFFGGSVFFSRDTFEEWQEERRLDSNGNYYSQQLTDPAKSNEITSTIYAGTGIGIEYKLTKNIRVAVEWPLTYSTEGDFIMYIPQAGLHYFF